MDTQTTDEKPPMKALVEVKPEPSPLAIYAAAVEKGLSVEQLSGLLDLHERTEKAKAEAAFARDMVACQSEMPTVVRSAENAFLKNKYAPLEDIQAKAKPIYTKWGFSLVWSEAESTKPGLTRITCDVMHREGHTKRVFGDYATDGTGAKGGANMNALQGRVSSNTYAQRDMLRSIFNITIADADDDGNLAGGVLTDDQIAMINDLFESCKKSGNPVNLARWLAWLKADSIETVRSSDFQKIVLDLNTRRKEKAK